MKMLFVKAGSFTMSEKDEENYPGTEISHRVTLTKNFYIGQFEVTQAQYQQVMGNNPSNIKKGTWYPVESVTWNDAMAFCEKLNSMNLAPAGYKFTLPTETQWEYAAKGGVKSKHYKYSGSNEIENVAWYWDNAEKTTHEVGTKAPNEIGVYDMSGNVFEWCLDDWVEDSSKLTAEFYRNNEKEEGPRQERGGSWASGCAWDCRSMTRDSVPSSFVSSDLGFRVALVLAKQAF